MLVSSPHTVSNQRLILLGRAPLTENIGTPRRTGKLLCFGGYRDSISSGWIENVAKRRGSEACLTLGRILKLVGKAVSANVIQL